MTGSFEDYLFSQKSTSAQNMTKKGKCIKCGECCSNFLILSEGEISQIRQYVSEQDIKPVKHSGEANCIDFCCPFLSMKSSCNIYYVRPQICRLFKCNRKNPTFKTLSRLAKEKRATVDIQ